MDISFDSAKDARNIACRGLQARSHGKRGIAHAHRQIGGGAIIKAARPTEVTRRESLHQSADSARDTGALESQRTRMADAHGSGVEQSVTAFAAPNCGGGWPVTQDEGTG
jgi:hypothetical protein